MRAEALLREVDRIRPILEERRPQGEAERALPDAAYDAIRKTLASKCLLERARLGVGTVKQRGLAAALAQRYYSALVEGESAWILSL